jgi:hypothetical protein
MQRKRLGLVLALWSANLSSAAPAGQEGAPASPPAKPPAVIVGTVADDAGRPIGGAEVSSFWLCPAPPGRPVPHDDPRAGALHAQADAEGRFELAARAGEAPAQLFAMDPERGRGGVIDVEGAARVEITVRPLVPVRGRCASSELGWLPREIGGAVVRAPGGQLIDWRVDPATGAFEFSLPPGDYRLYAMSTDARTWSKDVAIAAGAPAIDLGVVDLEPSIIARHYGREPPPAWTVTEARGVDRDVTLADYRGRWVLLVFWGFW